MMALREESPQKCEPLLAEFDPIRIIGHVFPSPSRIES